MSTLSLWHWFIALLCFTSFVFLPIIYHLYLWYVKKTTTSVFFKTGRRLRVLMGVLSLLAGLFSGLFVMSIYLMNIKSILNSTLSFEDLTLIETFLQSGGIVACLSCLIISWLLFRRWK